MRALLALFLLFPSLPLAAAQEVDDWSDPRPFRMTVELGALRDPLEGRALSPLARAGLVLVPLDVTAALRAAGTWPFDAAGRPLAWTFAPDSVRVVAAGSNATLPARFLPYDLVATGGEYEPSANAAGTLAVVLPPGVGTLHVYFDIAEHAARPAALPTDARAKLEELGGLGPWVATLAHVPRTPAGASPSLEILAPDGTASVRVQRIQAGAPATLLGQTDVALRGAFELPPTEQGYDILVTSDRPILATLRTSATAGGAFFHPALEGTAAGQEFLLATPGRVHVIGARSGTSVTVSDAVSGATLSTLTVGRLASAPIEIPPGALRRVASTAPVLVLQQGSVSQGVDAFLHVGRAIGGEAWGTLFLAARGAGHAALAQTPATAQAFPLASAQSVTSARVGETTQPAWIARSAPPAASEPWAFWAPEPLSILTGSDGYVALAGSEARAFDVAIATSREPGAEAEFPLMARVLAPFDGTRVEIERRRLDGAPGASGEIDLHARGALTTIPGTDEDLANDSSILRLRSSKPVFATLYRPGAPAVSALPGLPPIAAATRVELEYFGALLSWSPTVSFHTARAGETTRVALTLANLGRTREGEGIVENVALEARAQRTARCHADWEVTFPEATIDGFASPGQREVEAFVVVPEGAAQGECLELELVARSSYDPSVETIARATIRSRSGFQPELSVVRAGGGLAASSSVSLEPGVGAAVELRLRNVGGENGTAIVRHARAPGYESRIVARVGGGAIDRVELAGGEERRLWLELRAPTGAEPAWDFVIQATSVADPAARDEVVVTATPRPDLRLQATTSERRLLVTPENASMTLVELVNLGSDVELRARVAGSLPEGWTASVSPDRVLLRASGSRDDLGRRLDATALRVELRAPADARVGDTVPIAIELGSAGSSFRVPLLALVANDLRLEATPPPTILAGPREEGAAILELRSRAPGPMNVTLRSLAAPTGWAVSASEGAFVLAPGEAHRLTLRYAVEPLAPAGAGAIALGLQLDDAVTPPRSLDLQAPTLTAARPSLQLRASVPRVVLGPGEIAPVLFTLRNEGNVVAAIGLATSGPLRIDGTPTTELAPGGSIGLLASVGPELGEAELTIGAARASVDVVAALRDVRIVAANERTVDGVRYVEVEVENVGTVPSGPLRIALENATLDLPGLREGERVKHTLLAPADAATLAIRVESAAQLPDATAQDNVWRLDAPAVPKAELTGLAAAQRAVPGPAPIAWLALVLLLARGRSR